MGAGKVYYACYYICTAYIQQDTETMVQYYPLLVEAVVELKRFLRRWLCEYKGKQHILSD